MLRSALLLLVAVLMSVQAQAFDADREAKAFVQAVDAIEPGVSLQAREEAKALLRPHTEKFARGRSLAYHDAHPGVGPLVRLVRQAPLPEKAVQSLRQMWKDMGH